MPDDVAVVIMALLPGACPVLVPPPGGPSDGGGALHQLPLCVKAVCFELPQISPVGITTLHECCARCGHWLTL